jgi:hypothetical protein
MEPFQAYLAKYFEERWRKMKPSFRPLRLLWLVLELSDTLFRKGCFLPVLRLSQAISRSPKIEVECVAIPSNG